MQKMPVDINGRSFFVSHIKDVNFHVQNYGTGIGSEVEVDFYKTLIITVSGTSSSRVIQFEEEGTDGSWTAIMGTRRDKLVEPSSMFEVSGYQKFELDITGAKRVRVKIISLSDGYTSIFGRMVS